ncbi:LPXTG cell wall anchor domain-containing protein [Micromonospora sp. NPDC023737]|uniref:LPXTG cell wall anchor domain-containing protein n=1 Tax=unclassified Micromonospora TaxID=2617518 RepID=UPI00340950B0
MFLREGIVRMCRTAAKRLVGAALAAAAGVMLVVTPAFNPAAASPGVPAVAPVPAPVAGGAVAVAPTEPSGSGRVTFEVRPTSPQPTPPTPQPAPPTPQPTHGGQLPVTGGGRSVPMLAALGSALLLLGWLAARRRRPI